MGEVNTELYSHVVCQWESLSVFDTISIPHAPLERFTCPHPLLFVFEVPPTKANSALPLPISRLGYMTCRCHCKVWGCDRVLVPSQVLKRHYGYVLTCLPSFVTMRKAGPKEILTFQHRLQKGTPGIHLKAWNKDKLVCCTAGQLARKINVECCTPWIWGWLF